MSFRGRLYENQEHITHFNAITCNQSILIVSPLNATHALQNEGSEREKCQTNCALLCKE